MAVENCVQLSTSASVRATATKSHVQLPLLKEKCNLQTFHGLKRPFPSLTSSFSFSSSSLMSSRKFQQSSIVCSASKAASQVQPVTESSWESQVLKSQKTVLVDFWAPWCGPCKMIAPVIDELAKEYSGKIECYKVNTDECPNIATQYNIRSIPTVLFFKNGERKESIIGAVPKSTLRDSIDKYLAA